jgi:hypothetical protein
MKPIAIFYHCLFFQDTEENLLEPSIPIIRDQMNEIRSNGLLNTATEFHVGINGGVESRQIANLLIPPKAKITLHGLQCKNECRTLRMIEQWLPGHVDWNVLYFHSKGATHPPNDYTETWRKCMMKNAVKNWRTCVQDLDSGWESVGSHWMTGDQTPPGQSIWAGNFWWAKASFLATLPSIMERDRIKLSGIDSIESRYESEVWIGNGPRLPRVKDYHGPLWNPSKMDTCRI